MNLLDTLIWLLNFPASEGYAMVFIAGFSILGCFFAAFRTATPHGALREIREREGLPELEQTRRSPKIRARILQIVFGALSIVLTTSLIVGILSLVGVPVTRAYIHAQGSPTVGTIDGEWVTFTTNLGVEYTLRNDFFAPSVYPDRDVYVGSTDQVVVRYLPSHPQAYVIDSSQLPR